MKKAAWMAVSLILALPVWAQESGTPKKKNDVEKPISSSGAAAPSNPGAPVPKSKPKPPKEKAAQVPSNVSAGGSAAAARKKEERTVDSPASTTEKVENLNRKPKKAAKKANEPQVEEKAKPDSSS
jgi:hypothetical protein